MVRSADAVPSAIVATTRGATKASGASRRTWALAKGFAFCELGECRDRAEPEIFDPPASLGDGGQQSIAARGTHSGLSGRFMHDVIFRNRNSVRFLGHTRHALGTTTPWSG